MHVATHRRRAGLAATGVLALVAAILTPGTAHATAALFNAAGAYNGEGDLRYQSALVTSPEGVYSVATNLWNPAVQGAFTMNYDDKVSGFSVTNNLANSYFGTDANYPACTNGSDALDPNCDWAGVGDPWVNPKTGTRDQFATVEGTAEFVPAAQKPPAPVDNHTTGKLNEFSHQIHAPASYPSIIAGCHWGNCAPASSTPPGAPFPKQTSGVSRMDSIWTINTPTTHGTNEAWDASYDIWFDSNCRPNPTGCATQGSTLPTNPQSLSSPGQNDGAEIMLWVNNEGYNVGTKADEQSPSTYATHAGKIQPAGMLLRADVTIPGIRTTVNGVPTATTFDVWGGRVRSFDNGVRWNVISYVARTKGTGFVGDPAVPESVAANGGFDANIFTKYAASLDNDGIYCGTDPNSPLAPEATTCLEMGWWLTSVQAGFEIWNLPYTSTLATTKFSVNPIAVSGGINTGGRATADGTPLVHWDDVFTISATGCVPVPNNSSATWKIVGRNYATTPPTEGASIGGNLTYSGSGLYTATGVGPLRNPNMGYVFHDEAQVIISITCNGQTFTSTGNLFIDPSGRVSNTAGAAINGASVTLYRSATQNGTYTVVPNGSTTIMSPRNRANPSLTKLYGNYRWDVSPGWYKVRVSKAGCTKPGSSQTFVDSPVKEVAVNLPPVTNLDVVLYCGEGAASLPTTVVVRPPGVRPINQGGYCADVYVTNNTGSPREWYTTFAIPAGQHINQTWNMVLTQQGSTATAVHADPNNAWNKVLAPGATSFNMGFCTGP